MIIMKEKIKFKAILLLFSLILLCFSSKSYAASFSAKAANNTLNVGDTTTLTITANDCVGKFTISSSDQNIVAVSSSSKWIENTSSSITLTGKKAGNVTITVIAQNVSGIRSAGRRRRSGSWCRNR